MKKGDYVRFEVRGGKDDWDMTDKQYKRLLAHDGQLAKITSKRVTDGDYFNIKFSDGYKINAADLYGLEVIKNLRERNKMARRGKKKKK